MLLLLTLVFLASAGALHLRAQTGTAPTVRAQAPAFVGSAACATCHQRETAAWKGTQHADAMQHARSASVLGDFNGAIFTKDGVTTTFIRRDDRFFIQTEGPDGKPGEFEV